MKAFLWRLPEASAPTSQNGVSGTYILPKDLAPEDPSRLAGARLWMTTTGRLGEAVTGMLQIQLVERFDDGLHAQDYRLTIVPSMSFKTSRSYHSAARTFQVNIPADVPRRVCAVGRDLNNMLANAVTRAIPTRLDLPSARVVNRIRPTQRQSTNDERIAAVTTAVPLDEIWSGTGQLKGLPFASFALQAIERSVASTRDTVRELSVLDPMSVLRESDSKPDAEPRPRIPRGADAHLIPIDPEAVYARTFIASDDAQRNQAEKTEAAEKRHQDMLRDIVLYLLCEGFTPMQSASIDLFVWLKSASFAFELKTTTPDNINAQAAKGVFQLGRYTQALETTGHANTRMVLIMETCGDATLDLQVCSIVERFGVTPLLYDPQRSWPNRIHLGPITLFSILRE